MQPVLPCSGVQYIIYGCNHGEKIPAMTTMARKRTICPVKKLPSWEPPQRRLGGQEARGRALMIAGDGNDASERRTGGECERSAIS